jgi:hydroxypyruvate isomerase
MPRFSANLTFLFKELPFLDRFAAAREAGFNAVEILFPYDDPASEIAARLRDNGLTLALINTPPPNWAGGDRGFAAMPGLEDRFRRDFERCLRYADRLKPQHIHIMSGKAHGLVADQTFLRNLEWAAAQARGRSLTIEPINPIDMPGYYLNDFDQAAGIILSVGAANLGLQFDAYHAQIITGDAMAAWDRFGAMTRHIQVAGVPGRHEPSSGDIDYPGFFARLDREGYGGFVSGEYHPRGKTAEGLGWAGLG